MRNALMAIAGMAVISVALAGPALAQSAPQTPNQSGTGVPNVSNLMPFTADCNYMSLPGYLRYVSYDQTGQWLTYEEAARMVSQQSGQ